MSKIFRLPNGITCVTEERPQSGRVSIEVKIKAGSKDEPAAESGLTFLTQEAMKCGTTSRSRYELATALGTCGGDLGATVNQKRVEFSTAALARHAGTAFSILAETLRHPAFDPAEIAKTKDLVKKSIARSVASPEGVARSKFYEAAYAGQGLGRESTGTAALVDSFTPEQIRRRHAELLAHPEDIVVSFAGDIDAAAAEKMVMQAFGDLPPAVAPAATASAVFVGGDSREERADDQTNFSIGFKGPSVKESDRYAALLLQQYLSGGMSSPLMQEVREKRGLVYGISAIYDPQEGDSTFRVETGAGKGNAGECMSVIFDVLGAVARGGITPADLDNARESLVRIIQEQEESLAMVSSSMADEILLEGKTRTVGDMDDALRRVTPDDIRRLCASMLKDGVYAFSAVGPQETVPSPDEIKAMMQKQVEGVDIPAPRPLAEVPLSRAPFRDAAAASAVLPVPKMTVLANGMKVVTVERPGTLACGAWVGAGSDHETPELNGATHMNEHMMFKGTPSYKPGDIDSIVEQNLHGGLNAYTSRDRTVYYFFTLAAEALPQVIDICGEMVFKANLDHDEFDGKPLRKADGSVAKAKGERDVVIEELKSANDTVSDQMYGLMYETAYPGQAHGREVLGTEKTLRALTVGQLAAYRDEFYVPNNVVFCAVGPVCHEDFVALVESKYGAMPSRDFPDFPKVSYAGGVAYREYRNAADCSVLIGAESVPSGHPDVLAFEALAMILGGGTSSRLSQKVVDETQLASRVSVFEHDFRDAGNLLIVGHTAPDKVKTYVETVYAEMRRLEKDLTQEELDKTKTMLESELLASFDFNSGACDAYASHVQDTGAVATPAEIAAQIEKLTVDDVRRVLRNVLASEPTVIGIVPPGTDKALLPTKAEVAALQKGSKKPQKAAPRRHLK